MISMTELSKKHRSPESALRLRKRKASQKRLKFYGILAITLSGLALAILLWSVLGKSGGALTEHHIAMEITLDAGLIDRENIDSTDFSKLSKNMLKERFSYVNGRTERREMYDIISSGAAYELRDLVTQNPDMVGQTVTFDFLASDIADLYLKGAYGQIEPVDHSGDLTVSSDGGQVSFRSSTDDFTPYLGSARSRLLVRADELRVEAGLQENGRRVFTERGDPGEAALREAARDARISEAETLEKLAQQPDGIFELDAFTASIFLKLGQVWVQVETISANGGSGKILGDINDGIIAADDWQLLIYAAPPITRKVSDLQAVLLEDLRLAGRVSKGINTHFFTAGDSREPELAGIWGAAVGSFWTMMVTIVFAFFIGVPAAIYLEEFARDNKFTRMVEININNLAAVPSIVFGLLGLSVFIGFMGMQRSSPIVGGMVLGIMTLPVIIIAARAAIKAVPPSIRDGALALGASDLQVSMHHVLPLSMPGILTGTILGMARALGETAPLIMIGMVAFIVDIPDGPTDNATVLPVQIFRWADFPERAFEARTAAAILVLLVFLFAMNLTAILLRKRFERRW
ncbi:MAG: phosphate ABC transporter permease PstA [Rhodobacteraceae bacterium]|nr:phosphate ABC transporter permease PstA [Paracoccaceae bacterium]